MPQPMKARHTPEGLDQVIKAIRQFSSGPWGGNPPTLIEKIITRVLPYLDAEAANHEVIRLTVENLRLRAQIDAKADHSPA